MDDSAFDQCHSAAKEIDDTLRRRLATEAAFFGVFAGAPGQESLLREIDPNDAREMQSLESSRANEEPVEDYPELPFTD